MILLLILRKNSDRMFMRRIELKGSFSYRFKFRCLVQYYIKNKFLDNSIYKVYGLYEFEEIDML